MRQGPAPGWSLTGRVLRRLLLGAALGWVAVLGLGLAVIWHEMGELRASGLREQAVLALDYLKATGQSPPLRSRDLAMRVVVADGTASPAPWPALERSGRAYPEGWTVYRAGSRPGPAVEIGLRAQARRAEFLETARVFVLSMLVVLAGMLVLVRQTVRRALHPAGALARAMAGRSASDLSAMPDQGLPAELLPIAHALNGYLARIDQLLQAERHFAANAAHELRTPLAVARAEAQLIAEGRAAPESAVAMLAALSRLTALVERLLELARAEAGLAQTAGRADVVQVLRLLVRDFAPGRVLFDDGDIERLEIAADPDALAILLRNLIANAVAHGTGPVRVRLRPGSVLTIANPVAEGARFREARFTRDATSSGAGLGLSIARSIAGQLGLELTLEISEGRALATVRPSGEAAPEARD